MSEFKTAMRYVGMALCLGGLLVGGHARAKEWQAIPDDIRNQQAPLPLTVYMAQSELLIGQDPTFVPAGSPYGLVGALIGGALSSSQAKKDHVDAEPLLVAMEGYDGTGPLMAGIHKGLDGAKWLALTSGAPLRNNSLEAKGAMLAALPGNALADVDCGYGIVPSYVLVHVTCSVQVAVKQSVAGEDPAAIWKPSKLALNRQAAVQLAVEYRSSPYCFTKECRSKMKEYWSANLGSRLRAEIDAMLARAGELAIRQLTLTAPEIAAAQTDQDHRAVLPWHAGTVLEGWEYVTSPSTGGFWKTRKPTGVVSGKGVLLLEPANRHYYHRTIAVEP